MRAAGGVLQASPGLVGCPGIGQTGVHVTVGPLIPVVGLNLTASPGRIRLAPR